MDAVELRTLRSLGEREVWAVNDLPPGVDADLLRCLDTDQLVETRYVTAVNNGRNSDGSPRIGQSTSAWFSPIHNPGMAGGWDKIVEAKPVDCWNPPKEVRLTERGKAELARAERYSDPMRPKDPAAEQVMARAAMFRASGASVYPGVLLVIRGGSFALQPVEDAAFDSIRESIIGVAMWGLESSAAADGLTGSDEGLVPLIAVDRDRPRTGLHVVDAWIARADIVRRILCGFTSGAPGMDPAVEAAAVSQVVSTLRARSIAVIAVLPSTAESARAALAQVADSDCPTVEQLEAAIQSLLASAPLTSPSDLWLSTPPGSEESSRTQTLDTPATVARELRDIHWTILCHLATLISPVSAAALAGTAGLPAYQPLVRYLRELEVERLVSRPNGERSGWCITDEGRRRLRDNGLSSEA